ncbi:probable Histidine permease [Saccharomycodes ludwigii]|uniref:Probable Histidine permease n=1 Tax=Saccharomycodes ludwigii TaxID=36035 RepID=A0A376BAB1_9ASCO|nr:hypothetical protein SCDLUD_004838 [Saccharomycodes ludwigii]KAH3899395.1 hypothetical protein SCDLUD_004838 [Saccharomycodes ludwigii]SSD61519.1 probable Histidine permease [Saccharomycodes ludwigii]
MERLLNSIRSQGTDSTKVKSDSFVSNINSNSIISQSEKNTNDCKEHTYFNDDLELSNESKTVHSNNDINNDNNDNVRIEQTNTDKLKQDLSVRHLVFLAVGGSIGTGLFVNSGQALTTGGPASLVIDWTIISTALFTVMNALGELAAVYPVNGGFNVYFTRFIEPSYAFAVVSNYALQWLVLLPLELVAASITIQYWNRTINSDAWVVIFYVAIVLANFLDVKSFGETEFVLSLIKILAIIGFFILGIVLTCGGGPTHKYIGGAYWHDPGAFVGYTKGHRFQGLASNFVVAGFSFSGVETCCLAAAESSNPRKTLPSSSKKSFWIISLSYITVLTLVGCLVPYNDPRLLNGSSSVDAAASPLVIAIENAKIKGLPSLMNAIILIAIISVANSAVYACSRSIASMAEIGYCPKIMGHVDKKGRPIYAIIATLIFGLLSFVAASDKESEVFTWLSALSGLSTLFCWLSINLAHVRFRYAMKVQNKSLDDLPYLSLTGVWGSVYGIFIIILILIASFWTSLFPVGGDGADAESFFEGYLSFPILIACYIGHKIYSKNWKLYVKADEMDLDSGKRDVDPVVLKHEIEVEKEILRQKSLLVRLYHTWC